MSIIHTTSSKLSLLSHTIATNRLHKSTTKWSKYFDKRPYRRRCPLNYPFFLRTSGSPLKYIVPRASLAYPSPHPSDLGDDIDTLREISGMFSFELIRRLSKCYANVKVRQFRSYSLGLYDIALWNVYKVSSIL